MKSTDEMSGFGKRENEMVVGGGGRTFRLRELNTRRDRNLCNRLCKVLKKVLRIAFYPHCFG